MSHRFDVQLNSILSDLKNRIYGYLPDLNQQNLIGSYRMWWARSIGDMIVRARPTKPIMPTRFSHFAKCHSMVPHYQLHIFTCLLPSNKYRRKKKYPPTSPFRNPKPKHKSTNMSESPIICFVISITSHTLHIKYYTI